MQEASLIAFLDASYKATTLCFLKERDNFKRDLELRAVLLFSKGMVRTLHIFQTVQ